MRDDIEPYAHVFSADELNRLAGVLRRKHLETDHSYGVQKLGTVRRHRTGLAVIVDRWTQKQTVLYLQHDGAWVEDVTLIIAPKCEECDNLISEQELRDYEREAGFEAGYPRICSRLHPGDRGHP